MTIPEPSDAELAARLIRAGMRDAPAPALLQRTLAGLGVGAGVLGTASSAGALAATNVASVTALALTKWAGVGACAGLLLAASAHGVYRGTRSVAPASQLPATAHEGPGPVKLTEREASIAHEPVAAAPASAVSPASPRSAPSAPTTAATAGTTSTEAPLAAELAFVDRGREAFQRGDLAAALAALDGYERSFPEQRLLPEVLYLRMQALHRRGDSGRAAELARRLVRAFPHNPHASSARGLLGEDAAR